MSEALEDVTAEPEKVYPKVVDLWTKEEFIAPDQRAGVGQCLRGVLHMHASKQYKHVAVVTWDKNDVVEVHHSRMTTHIGVYMAEILKDELKDAPSAVQAPDPPQAA